MRTIIISILLMLPILSNAASYKYLYATKDKAKNAVLVSDKWANIEFDGEEEIIILSFEDKFAYFNILELLEKTKEKIIFKVLTDNRTVTTFTVSEDFVVFF